MDSNRCPALTPPLPPKHRSLCTLVPAAPALPPFSPRLYGWGCAAAPHVTPSISCGDNAGQGRAWGNNFSHVAWDSLCSSVHERRPVGRPTGPSCNAPSCTSKCAMPAAVAPPSNDTLLSREALACAGAGVVTGLAETGSKRSRGKGGQWRKRMKCTVARHVWGMLFAAVLGIAHKIACVLGASMPSGGGRANEMALWRWLVGNPLELALITGK